MTTLLSLLINRYVLGAAAVGMYAYPAVREAGELLTRLADKLASIPGLS